MSKSVTDLMMERFEKPKKSKRGGINSAFSEAIAQVMDTITDTVDSKTKKPFTFGRWCGHLRNIPPYEILCMLEQAKKAEYPGRLFNWLVKQYRDGKR